MMSCAIGALERRKVITVDINRAFMQAEMDKLVHIKLEEIMVAILVNIDPYLYNRYSVM